MHTCSIYCVDSQPIGRESSSDSHILLSHGGVMQVRAGEMRCQLLYLPMPLYEGPRKKYVSFQKQEKVFTYSRMSGMIKLCPVRLHDFIGPLESSETNRVPISNQQAQPYGMFLKLIAPAMYFYSTSFSFFFLCFSKLSQILPRIRKE